MSKDLLLMQNTSPQVLTSLICLADLLRGQAKRLQYAPWNASARKQGLKSRCFRLFGRPSTPIEACNIPRYFPQAENTNYHWYVCAWQDAVDFGSAHFASQALQDLYRFHGLSL